MLNLLCRQHTHNNEYTHNNESFSKYLVKVLKLPSFNGKPGEGIDGVASRSAHFTHSFEQTILWR